MTDDLIQGFKVYAGYFNDIAKKSIRDNLEDSVQAYINKTKISDTTEYFGFPYFIVLRVRVYFHVHVILTPDPDPDTVYASSPWICFRILDYAFYDFQAFCEQGTFYSNAFYNLLIQGNSVHVTLTYRPQTSRVDLENMLRVTFMDAVPVSLVQDRPLKQLVPDPGILFLRFGAANL